MIAFRGRLQGDVNRPAARQPPESVDRVDPTGTSFNGVNGTISPAPLSSRLDSCSQRALRRCLSNGVSSGTPTGPPAATASAHGRVHPGVRPDQPSEGSRIHPRRCARRVEPDAWRHACPDRRRLLRVNARRLILREQSAASIRCHRSGLREPGRPGNASSVLQPKRSSWTKSVTRGLGLDRATRNPPRGDQG